MVSTVCGGHSPPAAALFQGSWRWLGEERVASHHSWLPREGDGTTAKRLPPVGRAGESIHRSSSRLGCR